MIGILKNLFGDKPTGKATLSAVIIRADGTVEDLGVIAEGPISLNVESE